MRFRVTQVPMAMKPESQRILREEMMKARDQVVALYRTEVVKAINSSSPYKPVDTDVMRSGIHPEIVAGTLRGSVIPSPASEPYVVVQELGRRPGRAGPPLAPIRRWAGRKFGGSDADVERIARAVQKKLHERGMVGRFFFRRARQSAEARSMAKRLVLAAVRRWKSRIGGAA